MNPEYVLIEGDLVHLESGIAYVSLCGEMFHRDDVERRSFDPEDHETRCFECDSVQNRNAVDRSFRGP